MRTCYQFAIRVISKMFAVEVFFQITAAMERFETYYCRYFFLPKTKDVLSNFIFNWDGV